jgi:hypothetical protein
MYLNFIHRTLKFEKDKQFLLSENYEQTFLNKKHKQCNAHEKHKQSFPSEKYNRTFSLSFAGSWLKLYRRIIKKYFFTAKGAKKQITERN